jgi:FG-GAP repeat
LLDLYGRKFMFRVISALLICSLYLFVNPVFAGTLFINEDKLTAGLDAGQNDNLGRSVAVSGDTAVVGALNDADAGTQSGSAYVFVREPDGSWSQQQKLTASDAAASARFGKSVAIDGDTIVVGANGGNSGIGDADKVPFSGAAYVFVRTGTTWSPQQKLWASDPVMGDQFGESVAISGDTVVVGASDDDDAGNNSGAAHVFVRSGTTWTEEQILTANDAVAVERFGSSVAVSGDTAVMGAPGDDDGGIFSGSAYVFVRAGTTWSQQAKLTASDAAELDLFGATVAVSGDTAVVGALKNTDQTSNSGSAYVFVRAVDDTWSQQKELRASDAFKDDFFAWSVAIDGDTVVVGARNTGDAGLLSGAAYLFVRSSGKWTQQKKITASDAAVGDVFGDSVGISGNTVVVGAGSNDEAANNSGAAYVYKRVPNFFQATLSGTAFCAPEVGPGPTLKFNIKGKDKDTGTIILDLSALPVITAVLELDRLNEFNMTGMALLKNPKSGVFQLFGIRVPKQLAMSGTVKINKKTGEWTSLAGKFQWISVGGETCTMTGKFKAK